MKRLLLALLVYAGPAFADGPDLVPTEFADRAAQAFDNGDFAGAATLYEGAAHNGIVNGHLYYNLGLTYFRLGRTGDAMAAFLAARRYLPRDPDVNANLRTVLNGVHDKLDTEVPKGTAARLAFWLDRFTEREFALATAVLAALCGAVLSATIVVPSLRHLRTLALVTFLAPLLSGLSLIGKSEEGEAWGAVTDKEAKVYSGPGTKHPVVFQLQEGAPVLVTDDVPGGYARIQLSDGKQGWIADSQIKVFGPL